MNSLSLFIWGMLFLGAFTALFITIEMNDPKDWIALQENNAHLPLKTEREKADELGDFMVFRKIMHFDE